MITFAFKSAFMGCTWYECRTESETFQVCFRRELGTYERSILNGGPAGPYAAEVESSVGTLTREHKPDVPLSLDVLEAFNAFRLATHAGWLAMLRAEPERYGAPDARDLERPALAWGIAVYDVGLHALRFIRPEAEAVS